MTGPPPASLPTSNSGHYNTDSGLDTEQYVDLSWLNDDLFPLPNQSSTTDDGTLLRDPTTHVQQQNDDATYSRSASLQQKRDTGSQYDTVQKNSAVRYGDANLYSPLYEAPVYDHASALSSRLAVSNVPSLSHSSRITPISASPVQASPQVVEASQPAPHQAPTSKRTAKKRIRVVQDNIAGEEGEQVDALAVAMPTSTFVPPERALRNLTACVPQDHPLQSTSGWSYAQKHCFMITPLDTTSLDYFKRPLQYGRFAIHLGDPSEPANSATGIRLPLAPSENEHQTNFTITRPTGRSLHLLVTVIPKMRDPRQVDSGFALIIACRRVNDSWQPECLASFESTAQGKARGRSTEVTFKANIEHCVDEASGRRIWGQRTSHIRRRGNKDSLKAIRIQPRGPIGVVESEEFCFFAALFSLESGDMLRHADGSPCIARSNIVVFEPKERTDEQTTALWRELRKLTLFERAGLVTMPGVYIDLRSAITAPDADMLLRVGVNTFDQSSSDQRTLPSTAVDLSSYAYLDTPHVIEWPQFSDAFVARIRAVARSIGWHHADAGLTDPTVRTLESLNVICAFQRLDQILRAGPDKAQAWQRSNSFGEQIDHIAAERRIESAALLMEQRRFRAPWTVGMHNPYPERILVDRDDPDKVHCLADTTHEADVGLRDRMQALVRITYCTRTSRQNMEAWIFAPYVEGFQSRGTIALERKPKELWPAPTSDVFDGLYAGHPINGPLIEREKFDLLLHVMHLDYYLYWIHFRNALSARRIYRRLLEEDRSFPKEYYNSGGFRRFGQEEDD